MTLIDALRIEFEHEAETTRRHLERLPADKLEWRPHAKSSTARSLARHLVDCVAWADQIVSRDELDVDPATMSTCQADSVDELLKAFDDKVAAGQRALAGIANGDMMRPWRFKILGRVRFERPRLMVFRDFTLSHLIHHRGQLTVYLRLLSVPVPGSYGPTADDQF
jgi:uncharacterized damage-inducible protein DinB